VSPSPPPPRFASAASAGAQPSRRRCTTTAATSLCVMPCRRLLLPTLSLALTLLSSWLGRGTDRTRCSPPWLATRAHRLRQRNAGKNRELSLQKQVDALTKVCYIHAHTHPHKSWTEQEEETWGWGRGHPLLRVKRGWWRGGVDASPKLTRLLPAIQKELATCRFDLKTALETKFPPPPESPEKAS
jgi:hypothetical protein